MDLSQTIAPTSDQLDACDLLSGPRVFTVAEVSKGNAEQPVNIRLAEFPRVWRPGKSMRRVLVAAWGPDASRYVGRRVRLYCDDKVMFGGQAVGGTRISHLSDIDKPVRVPLLVTRGKSAIFVVDPLVEEAPITPSRTLSGAQIDASTDVEWLRETWKSAGPAQRARIEARVAVLTAGAPDLADDATFPAEPEDVAR